MKSKKGHCEVCEHNDVIIKKKLIIPRGWSYRTDDDEIIYGERKRSNIIDMCKDCNSLSRSIIRYEKNKELNAGGREVRRLMQRNYLIARIRFENREYIKDYREQQQKDEVLLSAQHMLSEAEERGGDQEMIMNVSRYLWMSEMLHALSPSIQIEDRTYLNFDDYLEFELVRRGKRERGDKA
jgi:hypothetical protein